MRRILHSSNFPVQLLSFLDLFLMALPFPLFIAFLSSPQFHVEGFSASFQLFLFAGIISLYPIGKLIGFKFFEALAPINPRKKLLLFGALGLFIGSTLSAISLVTSHLTFFLFSRIVSGVFGAIALFCTYTEPKEAERGKIGDAIGLITGFLLGSLFSKTDLLSPLSFDRPFWIASITSLATTVLIAYRITNEIEATSTPTLKTKIAPNLLSFFFYLILFVAFQFSPTFFRAITPLYFVGMAILYLAGFFTGRHFKKLLPLAPLLLFFFAGLILFACLPFLVSPLPIAALFTLIFFFYLGASQILLPPAHTIKLIALAALIAPFISLFAQ